jgi:hypothetical protein
MTSSKPILNCANPSAESSDDDKTKNFVSALVGTFGERDFRSPIDVAENCIIYVGRTVPFILTNISTCVYAKRTYSEKSPM